MLLAELVATSERDKVAAVADLHRRQLQAGRS